MIDLPKRLNSVVSSRPFAAHNSLSKVLLHCNEDFPSLDAELPRQETSTAVAQAPLQELTRPRRALAVSCLVVFRIVSCYRSVVMHC